MIITLQQLHKQICIFLLSLNTYEIKYSQLDGLTVSISTETIQYKDTGKCLDTTLLTSQAQS